tara:strand:+ start:187 stop:303 length:117 start_codon:yes stop_codon:yes gene_type:complete
MELPKFLNIKPQNELFGNTNNFFFWGAKMLKKCIFAID